jgi:hypothetical protein
MDEDVPKMAAAMVARRGVTAFVLVICIPPVLFAVANAGLGKGSAGPHLRPQQSAGTVTSMGMKRAAPPTQGSPCSCSRYIPPRQCPAEANPPLASKRRRRICPSKRARCRRSLQTGLSPQSRFQILSTQTGSRHLRQCDQEFPSPMINQLTDRSSSSRKFLRSHRMDVMPFSHFR